MSIAAENGLSDGPDAGKEKKHASDDTVIVGSNDRRLLHRRSRNSKMSKTRSSPTPTRRNVSIH
jgi:hypothetical protein